MNQKLKELAIEVCCQYQPLFDNIGMGQYTKSQYNKAIEDMMDKFAELIIRECAYFVDSELDKIDELSCVYGDQIKEHFGTKE